MFHKHWIKAVIVFLCLTVAIPATADVVSIKGEKLPGLIGQPTDDYGFFAVKNGQLKPVAFQWVEWSQENTPYFSKDSKLHHAGTSGVIDPLDRLILRMQDGGPKLSGQDKLAQPVAQLRVMHNHQVKYFYVVKNPYRHSTDSYVRGNVKKGTIKTTHYALFTDPDNLLVWKNFYYKGFKSLGGERKSILDTMKLRLSAGVFSKHTRITLTNDNLDPHIEQVIRGPLVGLIYANVSLKVAHIKVLSIHNYFMIKPNRTDIYARFTLPGAAKMVLSSPNVDISLDGNALYGSRLVTSWTGSKMAITDGRLSSSEKQMTKTPMPRNGWIFFDTGHKFNLLAQLHFSKNLDVPVNLIYQDSASLENKPERFPGQQPNVGFVMKDLPFGKLFTFMVSLIYNGNQVQNAQDYARSILSAPNVSYKNL